MGASSRSAPLRFAGLSEEECSSGFAAVRPETAEPFRGQDPLTNGSLERLLADAVRLPIEACVSAHLGRNWSISEVRDRTDRASHPAAILADESFAVFAKLGEGERAADQFEKELGGLRLLALRGGVTTPAEVGQASVGNECVVIMQAVAELDERSDEQWREIGRTLARIHAAKSDRFGHGAHCYWGDFRQDNAPLERWPEFFAQRRILPRLRGAVAAGHLPGDFALQVEGLCAQLHQLCGPTVMPTLVHGDAHQNNFLSTASGAVCIDPAVYYGHAEVDLAFVDFFTAVSDELFAGGGFEQLHEL